MGGFFWFERVLLLVELCLGKPRFFQLTRTMPSIVLTGDSRALLTKQNAAL
jgi:hypothetical protein